MAPIVFADDEILVDVARNARAARGDIVGDVKRRRNISGIVEPKWPDLVDAPIDEAAASHRSGAPRPPARPLSGPKQHWGQG